MSIFRFAILGPGRIARHFVHAVSLIPDCEVCAVASKSKERAKTFADEFGIPGAYGDYAEMLEKERPDCVYISTTHDSHFELCNLCLDHGMNILCEKTMFLNASQAGQFLKAAEEKKIFSMEAMWSRFLPSVLKAREWLAEGRIGQPRFGEMSIGFVSSQDPEDRIVNPKLGGGAALDISVYAYDLLTWVIDRPVIRISVEATRTFTGVDGSNIVLVRFEDDVIGVCKSSVQIHPVEYLSVEGTKGRIYLPHSHVGGEAQLYEGDRLVETYRDGTTQNGFVYEIREAMRCVREGLLESPVCSHAMTLSYARVSDRIIEASKV